MFQIELLRNWKTQSSGDGKVCLNFSKGANENIPRSSLARPLATFWFSRVALWLILFSEIPFCNFFWISFPEPSFVLSGKKVYKYQESKDLTEKSMGLDCAEKEILMPFTTSLTCGWSSKAMSGVPGWSSPEPEVCRNHVFTHCSFLEVGPRAEGGPSLQITVVTHQVTAFFLGFDAGRSLAPSSAFQSL